MAVEWIGWPELWTMIRDQVEAENTGRARPSRPGTGEAEDDLPSMSERKKFFISMVGMVNTYPDRGRADGLHR